MQLCSLLHIICNESGKCESTTGLDASASKVHQCNQFLNDARPTGLLLIAFISAHMAPLASVVKGVLLMTQFHSLNIITL